MLKLLLAGRLPEKSVWSRPAGKKEPLVAPPFIHAHTHTPSGLPLAVRCGGIGPDRPPKAPIGPEKAPISPEKAQFSRKDFAWFLRKLEVWASVSEPPPSTPNMTGRPGCRTMAMNGGSSTSHLACTPCVSLFCTLFKGGGDHVHCAVEPSPAVFNVDPSKIFLWLRWFYLGNTLQRQFCHSWKGLSCGLSRMRQWTVIQSKTTMKSKSIVPP